MGSRLAPLFVLALSLGCGPEPATVDLSVDLDNGLFPPPALKVLVQSADDPTPLVFGPAASDELDELDVFVAVDFAESFYLDVWGCPRVAQCRAEDRLARGCSAVTSVQEGQIERLTVLLQTDVDGTTACNERVFP